MKIFKKAQDHSTKFEKAAKGKTKKERRALEETLLKPDVLPIYTGPPPSQRAKEPVMPQTLLIVFKTTAQLDRLAKFFPVSYVEQPTLLNNKLVMDLVKEFEDGRIVYDAKKRTFDYPRESRQEDNRRVSKMGKRKRRATGSK